MAKSIGGSMFLYNCESQDYCFEEAIASLKALCDEIVILDVGSNDQTVEKVRLFEDEKTKIICLPNSDWNKMRGKEKLSFFSNIAIASLSTDWHFNLQADEVVHESCFPAIREAIEKDNEGYFVERINLWGNSQHKLNVPHSRSPVGTQIIRLCKKGYWSVDDGEGCYCPASWDYFSKIRIYHAGFVRDAHVHVKKIKHMLEDVFGMHNDERVIAMGEKFNPFVNFSKDDLEPIKEPLPIFIQQWAKERDEINGFEI